MSLHKRYGGLERLAGFSAVLHHYLAALFLDGEILVHLHVRRHPQHQSDNQSDAHLPHNLVPSLQSFLVAAEYLDIVVKSAEQSEPHRCHYHENEINVAQPAEQQHRHENGYYYYHSSHRRHAYLLHSERVHISRALRLGNLFRAQIFYESLAEPCRNDKRQHQCQKRPERYVSPEMGSGNAIFFKKSEQII